MGGRGKLVGEFILITSMITSSLQPHWTALNRLRAEGVVSGTVEQKPLLLLFKKSHYNLQ